MAFTSKIAKCRKLQRIQLCLQLLLVKLRNKSLNPQLTNLVNKFLLSLLSKNPPKAIKRRVTLLSTLL